MTRWQEQLCGKRGLATSLVEATLVIAIASILTSIALIAAGDQLEDVRLTRAQNEVKLLGVSVLSFIQDNGFPPAFTSGQARTSADPVVLVLESGGMFASDATGRWKLGSHDHLTYHLVHNTPGQGAKKPVPYPRAGSLTDQTGQQVSRTRGWNGPYLSRAPSGDPWGDKYLVNVGFLAPGGQKLASELFGLPQDVRVAVFVLSAGSNQTVETEIAQPADAFVAGGDDVIFRIQ